jgi:hypothetical protein
LTTLVFWTVKNSENIKNGAKSGPFFVPKKLHISTETGLLLLVKNLSAYDDYTDWDLTKHVLPCTL